MRNEIFTASEMGAQTRAGSLLEKTLFFHDISVHCRTNHAQILTLLEEMLSLFPEPRQTRGEVQFDVFCYEHASHFPCQLPASRVRTDTVELLTGTRLKYYRSNDPNAAPLEYHSYRALNEVNGDTLTVIDRDSSTITTQMEMPALYQKSFLRRYVFLLALGHVMARFGFEPFHAAAITSPWDAQQGALIVGASGSGKTTLSIGCAIAECGFLGDDLVMLAEQQSGGEIAACAITHEVALRSNSLPLWDALAFLKQHPVDMRDKRYCSIEAIRAGSAQLRAPIRLLLFPTLTTNAASSITHLSKAQALQELVEQAISKRRHHHQSPETLFAILSQLAQQTTSYRLAISRGANDGPQLVRSLFTAEQGGRRAGHDG